MVIINLYKKTVSHHAWSPGILHTGMFPGEVYAYLIPQRYIQDGDRNVWKIIGKNPDVEA